MIEFKNLKFAIKDNKILLNQFGFFENLNSGFCELQLCGENKDSHLGAKMAHSSEGCRLQYVSHTIEDNQLCIVQKSPSAEVKTKFATYDNNNTVRIQTSITNITSTPIIAEEASAFVLHNFAPTNHPESLFFTKFLQSHHAECQPKRGNFDEWGMSDIHEVNLINLQMVSQRRLAGVNIGSWSTKEELPQGILETPKGFLMFQIESNASWYYEISDLDGQYYLYLGGPNLPFGDWSKELLPGETYTTPNVALSFGENLDDVIGEMTKYRRHIAGICLSDKNLPSIFNEYMHLSWDSPSAENTAKMAPIVAKTGAEYYVIDCGWHNDEGAEGNEAIYPYVGDWFQSNTRFPEGVKKTTDFIRSLGMKPGLWIEPEIIGIQCEKMLNYYDNDCFFQRNNHRISVMNRHFIDYRHPKVREYMSETVRRMVEDYGAEYIKMDYNQDCGVGTNVNASSSGVGLEEAADAFLDWIREMIAKYPNVIFEGCASGGMRMDYKTLSAYSLVSTSDQIDYLKYPFIAGNILSSVLPEQAAVWTYPVTEECTGDDISDARIALNMINSFLGRMHIASHLERLNDHQMSLIKEGISYYNTLSDIKKTALPCFPLGFTGFGEKQVCAGFKNDSTIYLAVWNIDKPKDIKFPISQSFKSVKIAYPTKSPNTVSFTQNEINVTFTEENSAVFLEIQL